MPILIGELKTFVARGNSFAGQPGESDDLVMAMVVACRMVSYIATFEDDVFSVVNSTIGIEKADRDTGPFDEFDEPMPIGFL